MVPNAFVRKLVGYASLTDHELGLLQAASDSPRSVAAHCDLIREGDDPSVVFVVLEGWVCRYKVLPDGGRQIMAFMMPGDFCDLHIGTLEEMDHSVGTITACRVATIARDRMETLVVATPGLTRAFWRAQLIDQGVMRAWIVSMGRRDAIERVVTSSYDGNLDVMTMGWHMILEFSPSLVGCMISSGNRSFDLIRASRECVLNVPMVDLVDTVVAIGNRSGRDHDKFAELDLATEAAEKVGAPLLSACHANFECRLSDDRMVDDYSLFIFEIVKAHVSPRPKHPKTLHYAGDGVFVVAGEVISRRGDFRPALLGNGR